MNSRYRELDSLRGIAAMSVFIFHIAMILPDNWKEGFLWSIIFYSPFHLFFTGEQPVILFFVLSGFVLSLTYFTGKKISYFSFVIKRFFRLYLPYVVSIIVAILLCLLFSNGGNQRLGTLFNIVWKDPVNIGNLLEHFLFIGNYNVYSYNVVIWTLIHEMRISIILPLLVFFAIRFGWKINLAIGIGTAILGAFFHLLLQDPFQPFYKSLFYILMFIMGIILCKNRVYLIEFFKSLKKGRKITIAVIGAFLYIYADLLSNPLLIDWAATVGVSILLIISLSSEMASKILLIKPLQFLGKISFSLYLYHIPILLSLIYILYGKLPLLIIAIAAIILTILISNVAWLVIEKPSIRIANYFSRKVTSQVTPVLKKEKEIV
jgi:peptidoglycan/LPS O-acetylase OafA/YrhL